MKTMDFSETNRVNEGMLSFKVKVISLPWPKVIYI